MKLSTINTQALARLRVRAKRGLYFAPAKRVRAERGLYNQPSTKRSFTLVELLVVIMLITLLSSVVYVSYTRALGMGRDGRRRVDLASLRDALELYYFDYKSYPTPCVYSSWCDVSTSLGVGVLFPTYINPLPSDPKTGWNAYRYTALSATGQGYCLEANLEGTAPPPTCTVQSGYDYGVGNP